MQKCTFVARHRNPFLIAFELTSKGGGVANCLEVDLGSPENQVVNPKIDDISSSNNGKSFHAFGVVNNPEDFNNVIWGSEIASMSSPLKPGEGGSTTFLAGAPGTYYYICTVPGHALQGMQGTFIVE